MFTDNLIAPYLAQDPMNFVIKINNTYECANLDDLKTIHRYGPGNYRTWYACHRASGRYGSGNIDVTDRFVKMGGSNLYVRAPAWYPDGTAPAGSRVYELVPGRVIPAMVTNEVMGGGSMVSADHCNHTSPVQTYDLLQLV